jgi:hypothetical protein
VSPSFADQESLSAFARSLELYQLLVASPEILRGANAPQKVADLRVALLEAIRVNRELLAREN